MDEPISLSLSFPSEGAIFQQIDQLLLYSLFTHSLTENKGIDRAHSEQNSNSL